MAPLSADVIYVEDDLSLEDLSSSQWLAVDPIPITQYWSGEPAPRTRHASVRLYWSAKSFFVRFECAQYEPIIAAETPDLSRKAPKLWERDVCEIFFAPDRACPRKYFEFEVAPTGEWLDLAIEWDDSGRHTDLDLSSGVKTGTASRPQRVITAMSIPFEAIGGRPNVGDVWLGNLLRCVGSGPDRGYLAWSPTKTAVPNFHVPEAFGEFRFALNRDEVLINDKST